MKLAVILIALLPVVICMTVPPTDDSHEAMVRSIRRQSFGKPDALTGETVSNWNLKSGTNPEELGSYLEGDILSVPTNQGRNGIINTSYRWPNAIIFYKIEGNFSVNQTNLILQAMSAYHASTCVRFMKYNGTQRDYLVIKSDNSGCWATVGRVGGLQYVNLQIPGCVTLVGTAIHELMHSIGFFHEHSRKDRDEHVDILWQNIPSDKQHNFYTRDTTAFGVGYDYGSVMHYSAKAFSSNGNPTIQTRVDASIGQRAALSRSDIAKVNAMYNCPMGK